MPLKPNITTKPKKKPQKQSSYLVWGAMIILAFILLFFVAGCSSSGSNPTNETIPEPTFVLSSFQYNNEGPQTNFQYKLNVDMPSDNLVEADSFSEIVNDDGSIDMEVSFSLADLGINSSKSVSVRLSLEEGSHTSVYNEPLETDYDWYLDSTHSIFLNETPFFYLNFIPENHDVKVGVVGGGINSTPYNDGFVLEGRRFSFDDDFNVVSSNNVYDPFSQFHETLVGSIIASKPYNHLNLFGASSDPNGKIKILPVQFRDESGIFFDRLHALSIDYAVDQGVDIINCSFGDTTVWDIVKDAYNRAIDQGVVVINSAGNTGREQFQYPGSMDGVISVGGLAKNLSFSTKSSYGYIDFLAYNYPLGLYDSNHQIQYNISGTSLSAPQIAATFAKILSYDNTYTKETAYELIRSHSIPVSGSNGGHGYVDYKSLAEEFITFQANKIYSSENSDILFDVIFAKDRITNELSNLYLKYVYVKGKRYSIFQKLDI